MNKGIAVHPEERIGNLHGGSVSIKRLYEVSRQFYNKSMGWKGKPRHPKNPKILPNLSWREIEALNEPRFVSKE